MQIVFHLGAHCTDDDRLLKCLLKNRDALAEHGIAVPEPDLYRKPLRETALSLMGATASEETQAYLLQEILQGGPQDRIILSWDSFMTSPQGALRHMLYPNAGESMQAYTRIFPEAQVEFHLAIRNPVTFLPTLFRKQSGLSHEEFMTIDDPADLRWSDTITNLRRHNPGVPITVWCDEDTPLIWPEVLEGISRHPKGMELAGSNDLLQSIMTEEGLTRMTTYIAGHPPQSPAQRRRIVSAFLDKFARREQIEQEITMQGWNEELVDHCSAAYDRDMARIIAMPDITAITA
ncbi:MAG: hypothetical protein ACK5M4_15200 [Pseudorhodobacter sp.]